MAGAARAAEANAAAPAPASISRRFSGKKRSAAKQLLHQILPDRLAQLRRRAAENAARGLGNMVGGLAAALEHIMIEQGAPALAFACRQMADRQQSVAECMERRTRVQRLVL